MEQKKIAIFGAGIAGLSAAHELAGRGHVVEVYEIKPKAGGFFRSARREDGLPTEYSWHGFGPWYNNTFDIMKQIPFDQDHSLFEKALSRPIDFGIFPKNGNANFFRSIKDIKAMFQLTWMELVRAGWIMFKAWCANERSQEIYSQIRAVEVWENSLSGKALQNWKASFGPWIGSDWSRVSYHTAGEFFCKQLTSTTAHFHPPDEDGDGWAHGKRDGWLLLKGPSSEYWFDKWVAHLKKQGVVFHFESELKNFVVKGNLVRKAVVAPSSKEPTKEVDADCFILAANPYFAKNILFASNGMESSPELLRFRGLTQAPGHVQVSFRLNFKESIKFPRKRMAMVLSGTEFNLTLFAQEQAWDAELNLGNGSASLWTGTACIETAPGRLFRKPVITCSKEEFIEEIKAQIFNCDSLNSEIKKVNSGKALADFDLHEIEVWPEWDFSPRGIKTPWPKWVNNTINQQHLPDQQGTPKNLFVAGAHTKTQADVWSIEAAVESGRRAAKLIEPNTIVIEQGVPLWIIFLRRFDDFCYKNGLPHILQVVGMLGILAVLAIALD